MASSTEITVPQLSHLMGTPDAPVLIDVCLDEVFADDPRIIPTARRHPYSDIVSLASELQGQKVVVICHKGKKLSQGAAALLRAEGVGAETLMGGLVAWKEAGQPLIPTARIPQPKNGKHSLWVTRHRPKIDRLACPWLIRRFVDPRARFLFVAPSEVTLVAEKYDATPFDIEGVFWSHRGDNCTFDIMIEEFGLATEPLNHLAKIVRGADTGRLDLTPESPGLLAASLGLSRMYQDDLAQLDAAMGLYDAFYRWTRDAVNETHDRPAQKIRN